MKSQKELPLPPPQKILRQSYPKVPRWSKNEEVKRSKIGTLEFDVWNSICLLVWETGPPFVRLKRLGHKEREHIEAENKLCKPQHLAYPLPGEYLHSHFHYTELTIFHTIAWSPVILMTSSTMSSLGMLPLQKHHGGKPKDPDLKPMSTVITVLLWERRLCLVSRNMGYSWPQSLLWSFLAHRTSIICTASGEIILFIC